MSTQISTTATHTREGARRTNGEFGTQPHAESGVVPNDGTELAESVRVVSEDGTQAWFRGDELHRVEYVKCRPCSGSGQNPDNTDPCPTCGGDGLSHVMEPAVIRPNGIVEFWVNGEMLNSHKLLPGYLPEDEPPF